jgi:hypothetical protein
MMPPSKLPTGFHAMLVIIRCHQLLPAYGDVRSTRFNISPISTFEPSNLKLHCPLPARSYNPNLLLSVSSLFDLPPSNEEG